MADTKKILISVEIKEIGAKQVSESSSKAAKDLSKLTNAEKAARIEAEKLKITNAQLAESFRQQAAAELQAANNGKPLRAQAGLNNAILLETSRLASDASYGFTAIANNLSQVVSLFFSFSKTAGGVVNSLKELGKSILGTGGILIAVQLLIAYGDDLYNFFFNTSKAANDLDKEIKELTKSLDETINRIQDISGVFQKYLADTLSLADTVSILENKFSRFKNGLDILREKGLDKNSDSLKNLVKDFLEYNQVLKQIQIVELELQKLDENGLLLTEQKSVLIDEYRRLLLQQIKLEDLFTKKSNSGSEKRIRQFKRGFLDLSKLEERYRQESIYQETLTEQQKIDLKYNNAKEEAQILLNQFTFEQAIRLRRFLSETKDASARKRAIDEYNQSIIGAQKDFNDVLIQISAARENKILESLDSQQSKALSIREKLNRREADLFKFGLDANQEYYEKRREQLEKDIAMRQYALNDFTLEQDQRAKIELELFNLREELRQNDLKSETDAIKEKQRVNQEYVSFVQSAAQIFRTIAGENEELQKVALVLEQGAAIADVVIRTQASNAQIRAGYAATAAIRSAFDPTALVRFSTLAEAQVQRNNIGAGFAIANILATTLTSFKNPSGDSKRGGGAMQVEAPDFNVVGASPESQLAQTVAAQQAAPLKAFVVGKEITTQQEFDRNILTNASL